MEIQAKALSARSTAGVCVLICSLALLFTLTLIPSTKAAAASRPPEPLSPIENSGITAPGGVTVDEGTGNVFLNDGTSNVSIFGAEGGSPVGLVPPFQLSGFSFGEASNGIAFDNSPTSPSQGTLYIVNAGGKIKVLTRNILTEKYELVDEWTATGASFGSGNSGAGVDANGNLFVGDFNCECVVKFDPEGNQVAFYDLSSTVVRPGSVAVSAAGDLFVSRIGIGSVYKFPANGSGEISPSNFIQVLTANATSVAVDRARDKLYIALGDRVAQHDATTLVKDFEFGAGVLNATKGLTVNSVTDRIYVSNNGSVAEKKYVAFFGPPVSVPTVTTKAASDVTGTAATLNGIVNPEGVEVTDCKFEFGLTSAYGSTVACEGSIPTDFSDHAVSAAINGLESNGTVYHYRLVVSGATGSILGVDRAFITDNTVFTQPATAVEDTGATLNGIVRPEGEPLTECKFEYGTALDYSESIPCSPPFSVIPDDFDDHAVSATPSDLEPNTTYHFRLTAANADGTDRGEDRTFTTVGPPQILEQRPLNADRTSVTLQARIDPRGSPTTYHFEFGTGTSYGTRIPPDHELFAGSGTEPVVVSAFRGGLQEKSVYYFRVVATSAAGTTTGPDQRLETLNANGLPSNRGIELVSPAVKGPSGSVSDFDRLQVYNQASDDGDAIVYPIQNGIPDSTAGGWTRWRASRSPSSDWSSAQVSPPSLLPSPDIGLVEPSLVKFASPDLDCAIVSTHNPLTEDTPLLSVELGVKNLYRWNADGSYDLLTDRVPLNPGISPNRQLAYSQIEASDDCSRVYFRSEYEFIAEGSRLYEWDNGTLRDAGVLPNGELGDSMPMLFGPPSAKAIVGAEVPALFPATARWNAVTPDGSLFSTAISNDGLDIGTPAVFMRENGVVIDITQSQTTVPTNGARFEAASADGGRVFFRANYGIAATSSSEPTNGVCGPLNPETSIQNDPPIEAKPCDLYAYDVETGDLTAVSADPNPADPIGAAIQGTVAIDEDGSHVYFAALSQLVSGEGRTYAQNVAGQGSANIYLARDVADDDDLSYELSYVTTLERINGVNDGLTSGDLHGGFEGNGALMRLPDKWSAETTPDGAKLLFESAANLTDYDGGGGRAIYLYSAPATPADAGQLTCISCPPDGAPTLVRPNGAVDSATTTPPSLLASPRGLWLTDRPSSMSEDGGRIFFTSPDVLAPGALKGKRNVYVWQEGQVFFLAVAKPTGGNGLGEYLDASASGDDAFIATAESLAWQDKDFVSDVYDVRVDGVVPPEPVDNPCDPAADRCQDPPVPQPAAPSPASAGFQGSGNPAPPPGKKCGRAKVLRKGKCVKKRRSGKGRERSKRRTANSNRGGVK